MFRWLIAVKEMCQISRNRPRQGPQFRKLQEAIELTVINEIIKFPPRLVSFGQETLFVWILLRLPELPKSKMMRLDLFPDF